jgi:hypothetical protein
VRANEKDDEQDLVVSLIDIEARRTRTRTASEGRDEADLEGIECPEETTKESLSSLFVVQSTDSPLAPVLVRRVSYKFQDRREKVDLPVLRGWHGRWSLDGCCSSLGFLFRQRSTCHNIILVHSSRGSISSSVRRRCRHSAIEGREGRRRR